jgi:MarR family 2-MHQ and catechol resistance regulon transcriptional repressor
MISFVCIFPSGLLSFDLSDILMSRDLKKMQRASNQSKEVAASTGVHLWLVLWRAYDALRRRAEANIAHLGIAYADFAVLEALLHKGPLPVNTIGRKVNLTSGSITTAVDRLEAKGLVKRKADPEDGRTRMVCLTPAGRKLIEPAFEEHAREMEAATAGLSERERAEAVRLLRKLGLSA